MSFNVLVTDDSETVRKMIKRSLEVAQVSVRAVFEAENGKDAIDVLKNESIDVIFLDLNMPVMNGVEFMKTAAVEGYLRGIPVIVITAEGSGVKRELLLSMGASEFVQKPFHPEDIRDTFKRALAERSSEGKV